MNLQNIINDIGRYCGLTNNAELGYSSSKLLTDKIAHDTKGAVPLAQYLNYRYYDSNTEVFINDDGIVGFMLEISPIVGSDKNLEKNLNLFFNDELPEGTYLQFLLIAGHNIDEKIEIWKKERGKSGNKMLEQLTKYREAFLREKASDYANCDGRMGRDFRVYVSYSSYIGNNGKKLETAIKFQQKLIKKLESINLYPKKCKASDLISVVRDLIQMKLYKPGIHKSNKNNQNNKKASYNPINCLSQQILEPLTSVTITEEEIIHQDTGLVTKCFYPAKLPDEYSLIEMIELLGSHENSGNIPARFVLSYSLSANIDKAEESKILSRGSRSIHASEKWYARNDMNLKAEAAEWHGIIARHKNGERFLTENMSVIITAPYSEIELAEEKIKSHYNSKDWQLKINKNLQLPSLLSILPMQQAAYWKILKYFQLVKNVQAREVVAKLPIHGEWKGVQRSGMLLLGRRGELFNWNPFCRVGGGGNYNLVVMAPSGSGKSFFLQELATTFVEQDTAVFILDIGGSYQNICEGCDGELIRFNSSSEISLNPFAALAGSGAVYIKAKEMLNKNYSIDEICQETGLSKEKLEAYIAGVIVSDSTKENKTNKGNTGEQVEKREQIEVLKIGNYFVAKDAVVYAKSIIATMCGVSGNNFEEAIIEEAINTGIEKYGTELDVTKLAGILKNRDVEIAKVLAQTLYPYTDKGIHGRFFKGGNAESLKTASFKKLMTVFEFEEIKNDKVLLSVVLQVILMQVTMQFLCGDRSKKFVLKVDEAWCILDFSSAFLEAFCRTVRKYEGCLITCVQDYSNFQKGPSHKAIFENSTWKAVLMQEASGLASFRDSDQFRDCIPLIESVRKDADNKYSEILLFSNGLRIVGRLAVDPYSTALYSTEGKDYNFLSKCKANGMSKDESIKELSKKYGKLPEIDIREIDANKI